MTTHGGRTSLARVRRLPRVERAPKPIAAARRRAAGSVCWRYRSSARAASGRVSVKKGSMIFGVPEDVALVRAPGEAARADRDPVVVGVGRAHQVVDGEAQRALGLGVTIDRMSAARRRFAQRRRCSSTRPSTPSRASARSRRIAAVSRPALGDSIARRADGEHAVEPIRAPDLDAQRHALTATVRAAVVRPGAREGVRALEEARARELDGDASRGPQRYRRGTEALHHDAAVSLTGVRVVDLDEQVPVRLRGQGAGRAHARSGRPRPGAPTRATGFP